MHYESTSRNHREWNVKTMKHQRDNRWGFVLDTLCMQHSPVEIVLSVADQELLGGVVNAVYSYMVVPQRPRMENNLS